MKERCIIIAGPTAVGKTAASLELAHHLGGEIVNADMGQFYKKLSIGTAKPDWQNSPLAHHHFDILDLTEPYNVSLFRTHIKQLITHICERGKIPIIVGGSGFYCKALFFEVEKREADDALFSREIAQEYESQSTQDLWNLLYSIDSDRARQIHINDRYRLVSALTLWRVSGKKPSSCVPVWNPLISEMHYFSLQRVKSDLHSRITERTKDMLAQGWIEEVMALTQEELHFVLQKKFIGYPEIIEFVKKGCPRNELSFLEERIIQKTKQYAKRQLTFDKGLLRELVSYNEKDRISTHHINLTISDLNLYIKTFCETMTI